MIAARLRTLSCLLARMRVSRTEYNGSGERQTGRARERERERERGSPPSVRFLFSFRSGARPSICPKGSTGWKEERDANEGKAYSISFRAAQTHT